MFGAVRNQNGMAAKVAVISTLIVVVFAVAVFGYNVSVDNREVDLRNRFEAQLEVREANYDKMWKTIKEVAGVTDMAKKGFKEMYQPLIEGRYGTGQKGKDPFMLWIKEQNPEFDWSLYKKVQTAVESLRDEFFYEQKKLVSIQKQHKDLLLKFPSKMFTNATPLDFTLVSSSKAKVVMTTGLDDEPLIGSGE